MTVKSFFKDFQTFAVKGNAIDLAVGVVIGAAFNQVTTSLSTNIISPPIGLLLGGTHFETLAIHLPHNIAISYGLFLEACINFILIALALFIIVKFLNSLTRQRKQDEKKPAENPELKVLMEIRDVLEKRRG